MAEHTIVGRLLDKPEERDAIHVAVAPVIANEPLQPGQHIGFATQGDTVTVTSWPQGNRKAIGIVDPFLHRDVEEGQRFWMFLYPNTITSLKHQWTHPAFGPEEKVTAKSSRVSASEQWLRDFSESHEETYNTIMEAAKEWLTDKEYLCRGGKFEGERVPDEFWTHYERVTGTIVDEDDKENFFTCSC